MHSLRINSEYGRICSKGCFNSRPKIANVNVNVNLYSALSHIASNALGDRVLLKQMRLQFSRGDQSWRR